MLLRSLAQVNQSLTSRLKRKLANRYRQRFLRKPVLTRSGWGSAPGLQQVAIGQPEIIDCRPPLSLDPLQPEILEKIGEHRLDAPRVLVVEDARLMGRHAVVSTQDDRILLESTLNEMQYLQRSILSPLHEPSDPIDIVRQLTHVAHYDSLCILVNLFSRGFYHWMTEVLPRLERWQALREEVGMDVPLLIDPDPAPWMLESLRLLGFDTFPVQPWQATQARVRHLYLPTLPGAVGLVSPRSCRWMAQRMLQSAGALEASGPAERIYISRAATARRRVLNEEALMPLLQERGFRLYQLEKLSIAEQIRLFHNAEAIIGPHGAGFTNMIYAKEAAVLEFFEPGYGNGCYYTMAQGLGHRYGVMLGESQGEDMLIDADRLRRSLDLLGIG